MIFTQFITQQRPATCDWQDMNDQTKDTIKAALQSAAGPREVETLWLLAEQCSTHFGNGIDQTRQINKTLALLGGKEGE